MFNEKRGRKFTKKRVEFFQRSSRSRVRLLQCRSRDGYRVAWLGFVIRGLCSGKGRRRRSRKKFSVPIQRLSIFTKLNLFDLLKTQASQMGSQMVLVR